MNTVFYILEKEAVILEFGLDKTYRIMKKKLDYFMEHIEHPICNSIPVDSIINLIESDILQSNKHVEKIKKVILEQLEKAN